MSQNPANAPNPALPKFSLSGARVTSTAIVVAVNDPMRDMEANHDGEPLA